MSMQKEANASINYVFGVMFCLENWILFWNILHVRVQQLYLDNLVVEHSSCVFLIK